MKDFRSALVAGATGLIGSSLVQRLVAENVKVTCIIRKQPRATAPPASLSGASLIEVPNFDASTLKRHLHGYSCDAVFNLASYGVHQHDRDPDALVDGNAGVLTSLLTAASAWPLQRFIHAGSCSEYGSTGNANLPISETQPLRPASPYGVAKANAFMQGTALAHRLNLPFITLRLFNVFGFGETPERLLPFLIRHLQDEQPAELTGGEQLRDFLYIDDVVAAFLPAAREDRLLPYEAYNVCSGRATSVRQVGQTVADVLRKPRHLLQWGKVPYRKDEPMWVVGNNSRFTQATSWRPMINLAEGIRRIVAAIEEKTNRERPHAV